MIVYKVVYINWGNSVLTSAIAGRQEYQQTYVPGEVTKARLGWLFAFEHIQDARELVICDFLEVWEARTTCCEPITEIPGDGLFETGESEMRERFEAFWKRGEILGKPMLTPPGTVICPELTLLRRV